MLEYILHDGWWLSVSHVDYLMHRNGDFIFGFPKLLFSWKKMFALDLQRAIYFLGAAHSERCLNFEGFQLYEWQALFQVSIKASL